MNDGYITQRLNKVKSMHECKIHNVLTKAFINEECRYWATHLYIHVTYIYFILPAVMSYIYCSIVFRQLSDTFVNFTFSADEYNIFTIAIIYTLICVCVYMYVEGGGVSLNKTMDALNMDCMFARCIFPLHTYL